MRWDQAALVEDRGAPRREVAAEVANLLGQEWDRFKVTERGTQDGPLGGRFELIMVDVPTPHGTRRVRICVYGVGVFADEEEERHG